MALRLQPLRQLNVSLDGWTPISSEQHPFEVEYKALPRLRGPCSAKMFDLCRGAQDMHVSRIDFQSFEGFLFRNHRCNHTRSVEFSHPVLTQLLGVGLDKVDALLFQCCTTFETVAPRICPVADFDFLLDLQNLVGIVHFNVRVDRVRLSVVEAEDGIVGRSHLAVLTNNIHCVESVSVDQYRRSFPLFRRKPPESKENSFGSPSGGARQLHQFAVREGTLHNIVHEDPDVHERWIVHDDQGVVCPNGQILQNP
mmetsp:Transcript_15463/g.33505  ORF Transcript_15463/g.33505 Transcript_15463/m.33505 type:complete len:254 (+) Transcript_15463:665-1426(+)